MSIEILPCIYIKNGVTSERIKLEAGSKSRSSAIVGAWGVNRVMTLEELYMEDREELCFCKE